MPDDTECVLYLKEVMYEDGRSEESSPGGPYQFFVVCLGLWNMYVHSRIGTFLSTTETPRITTARIWIRTRAKNNSAERQQSSLAAKRNWSVVCVTVLIQKKRKSIIITIRQWSIEHQQKNQGQRWELLLVHSKKKKKKRTSSIARFSFNIFDGTNAAGR